MRQQSTIRNAKTLVTNKKLLFVVAGICNTAIDFALFNILIIAAGLKPWIANIISTSVAMVLSFLVNKHAVFSGSKSNSFVQFVAFIGVTAAGLWGLQTVIVISASSLLHPIARHVLGLTSSTAQVLVPNGAKVIATIASAVWNYIWYDRVIFARSPVRGTLEEWL